MANGNGKIYVLLFQYVRQVDGPCTTYLGPIGSGNYVKMVHNGIEYGDMQLIAEVSHSPNMLLVVAFLERGMRSRNVLRSLSFM